MSTSTVLALLGALTLSALVWLASVWGRAQERARSAQERDNAIQEVLDAVAEVDATVGRADRDALVERMRRRLDGD